MHVVVGMISRHCDVLFPSFEAILLRFLGEYNPLDLLHFVIVSLLGSRAYESEKE